MKPTCLFRTEFDVTIHIHFVVRWEIHQDANRCTGLNWRHKSVLQHTVCVSTFQLTRSSSELQGFNVIVFPDIGTMLRFDSLLRFNTLVAWISNSNDNGQWGMSRVECVSVNIDRDQVYVLPLGLSLQNGISCNRYSLLCRTTDI